MDAFRASPPFRLAVTALGVAAGLGMGVPQAAAQDDVELLGAVYGTRPPAAYRELRSRDPGAFRFSRAWKARNPGTVQVGVGPDGRPRFELRPALDGPAGRTRRFEAPLGALGRRDGVVEGTFRFPLVLGYFADDAGPPPYTAVDIQREFFDGPNSRYKTIPEFYEEISGGRVRLEGDTHGWVQAGLSRLETTDGVSALGGRIGLFIYQLLEALDDGSIDWGRYDNDGPDGVPNSGDDDGFVDVLAVLHPTTGAECGGADQDDRVWSHKWSLSSAYNAIPLGERPPETTFATGSVSAAGGVIRIDDYTVQPVLSCGGGEINQIGVLAHELGHGFGLPDLYCTTSGCRSHGIGRWGLMGSGSWGCGTFDPARPCSMSAWSKSMLGWVEVEALPLDTDHGTVTLDPVATSGRVLRLDAGDGSDEYFLLENRQRIGFDEGMPGTGLLVWHIDPDWIADRWAVNRVNPPPTQGRHLGVRLRQADGFLDLEGGVNRSDGGDPFPGDSATDRFHAGIAPQSITHEGRAAGVTLVDIREVGGSVTFRAVSGFRDVRVDVTGTPTGGLVLVDDEPLPVGGATFRRAPFEGLVLNALPGESLGPGIRRPFLEWSDDPTAAALRVFRTPLEGAAATTAVYGGEEVEITPEIEGGLLDVSPGRLTTSPPSPDLWVPAGDEVTLRADPAEGFAFEGWLGEWVGRPNPFTFTATSPVTVGARFGLTFVSLATALAIDPGSLDSTLRWALDDFGNGNGRYDVGDLRAYLRGGGSVSSAVVETASGTAAGGEARAGSASRTSGSTSTAGRGRR